VTLAGYDARYAERCATMYQRLFTSPEWGFDWLTLENTRRYFRDLSAAPRFLGYIYLNGDRPIGCCMGEISDYFNTTQYTVKEIFIDPPMQGRGCGSGFLDEIGRDLKKNKVDNIVLSTSKNIKAYGFYLKNGFAESPDTVFLVKFIDHFG